MINFAGFPFSDIDEGTGDKITQARRKPIKNLHLKYIDDLSYLTSINVKKDLIENPVAPERPVTYHNRTNHILPNEKNVLQEQMDRLTAFVNENEMKINPKKSKIMVFNPNKKYDFHPTVTTDTGTTLDIKEEFKLLGIKITSDMKWHANTQYMCAKGYYCQTPVLGLGLGVDFTFTPLHISPATLAHLPGNLCTPPRQPKPTTKLLSNSRLRLRT